MRRSFAGVAVLTISMIAAPARAGDFYAGKTLRLIVNFAGARGRRDHGDRQRGDARETPPHVCAAP